MKCFIVDTLAGIFAIDESETILNFIEFISNRDYAVKFFEDLKNDEMSKDYNEFIIQLHKSGFKDFIFDNEKLERLTSRNHDVNTQLEKKALEFRNFRLKLRDNLPGIGINIEMQDILAHFKHVGEEITKKRVSEVGSRDDVLIIQEIETLDMIKKSISLFSSRLREWYGLHFPELTDKLIEDNVVLAEMISKLGTRKSFSLENLSKDFNLSENRIKVLHELAVNSMGADFELDILRSYAGQIISLDHYRKELENHLEMIMTNAAPNLTALIGSLIGAKLISQAGSLKKLAYMPASRIQILGAEKALYRYLKTGEKQPKHGLIFQWNQIRGSKPWNRGRISRVVSGKIAISAKIDFFEGDFIADILSEEIEAKIKEIERKYPNPPPKKPEPIRRQQKKKQKPRKKKR